MDTVEYISSNILYHTSILRSCSDWTYRLSIKIILHDANVLFKCDSSCFRIKQYVIHIDISTLCSAAYVTVIIHMRSQKHYAQ